MIQFNLLPDIKIKYIKARRQKRTLMLVATIVGMASLGLMVLMAGYVYIVQGAQIASLNNTITKSSDSIKNKRSQVDDINKVLTVQSQLGSLDTLHESKPLPSRTFGYLAKLKPESVTITKVTVTIVEGENVMSIEGETKLLESVNTFIDTLKFSSFAKSDGSDPEPVFTGVVLTDFSRDKENATYVITLNYDPIIFSSSVPATNLVIPKDFISTRSATESPVLQDGLINKDPTEDQ
jgi:Tfp pilus assembly protein PilN